MHRRLCLAAVCSFLALGFSATTEAEDPQEKKTVPLELADGKLIAEAPAEWKKVKPRSGMLAYEFSAPADAKKDDPSARITFMSAGGSIEANIERWYGQFTQPDGSSTKKKAKSEKFDADGQTVHYVDIPGTFSESMGGGPFAPGKTVTHEDHRMLGAIVETKAGGKYFIKMTGPSKVCEGLSEGFLKMLKGLKAK